MNKHERTGSEFGCGIGVAGPQPAASTDDIDAVLGGVGLILHKHTVAGDESDAVDGLGPAERDDSGSGGLDLVIRAGGRYGGELQAGLAEDRGGGIEECPAASLGAPADEDGEAR